MASASELSTIEVRAQAENMEGVAAAASEGVVSKARLARAPILRPGEVLEMVPGLIVTQHAGDGKANQYFLRGFNLDHGTDFATHVGGVPVNMPSHAHGQGYTDLNFLIPELVDRVAYRKGPYSAEEGDFSSAGAVHIDYLRKMEGHLAQLTLGQHGYARNLFAGSSGRDAGQWLYGLEVFHHDGPWQIPENYRKLNGVLRYSEGTRLDGWSVTGMAYRGRWISTDQVAQRAVDAGVVDRFGSLDSTAGGASFRYSLAGEWARRGDGWQSKAVIWGLQSGLDLWSNFQYALNDPVRGDQFLQRERRTAGGFSGSHAVHAQWGGREVINTVGVQVRHDRLAPVGLYSTQARETLATVREDKVRQTSAGLWLQNEIRWQDWLRSIAGLRSDAYRFAVDAHQVANSGTVDARMVSPKLALVFGPWRKTEFYFNYGHGFHSNDARGSTMRRDPVSGANVEPARPLVRTRGQEVGVRSEIFPGWQSTVSLWQLDAASELLFVGDAGTTEAARASQRRGVEWTNFYAATNWLSFDADLAWTRARFRGADAGGVFIPGAVPFTANLGLHVDQLGAWSATLRLRYFGARPLDEEGRVRAGSSALTNLRVAYRVGRRTQWSLDIYNLFDRRLNDIEYFYCSRLPGEAANPAGCADGTAGGYDDRHVHPAEPRNVRLTMSHHF